jgi:alkylated DNA nucleotide flippase Atl1
VAGIKSLTSFLRVIKADGSLNEKLPGGTEAQAFYLRGEGYEVEAGKGKKPPRVIGFQPRAVSAFL